MFYGEKPDESVWNFLTVNVRRRGVSLFRGGQNSLWTNESLCLTGNTQGMCSGGGGAAASVVSLDFGIKSSGSGIHDKGKSEADSVES